MKRAPSLEPLPSDEEDLPNCEPLPSDEEEDPPCLPCASSPTDLKAASRAAHKRCMSTMEQIPVPDGSRGDMLELFAGTGSIGRAFARRDFRTVSLDIATTKNCTPTVLADIRAWDFKSSPYQRFDIIWSSPPCTEYSRARTTANKPRDLEQADALVKTVFNIVDYYKPKFWFLENPDTGMLKKRPMMTGIRRVRLDYCMYGTPYRKRTSIWGKFPPSWIPRPLCTGKCGFVTNGRHWSSAQQGSGWNVHELHAIPRALCEEIADACKSGLSGAGTRLDPFGR